MQTSKSIQERHKLRNIGIIAHIDAGKTTVTERVLFYAGKTYKMGEVHDGTAVMDYMAEEQERGITITSAATKYPWKDAEINLIDTPGHIDFTAEVERSLRVLDGAVAVFDASEGVQAQSETVWRQGQKYGLPYICFINKMDKVGADFQMCISNIRNKLLANPVVLQIPIGAGPDEAGFRGIIDVLEMRAIFYKTEELGAVFEEVEIPAEFRQAAEGQRHQLIEQVAEQDEQLMQLYVHNESISTEQLKKAIRKGTINNKLHPVFVGSALRYVGVQRLLDGVVDYFPSPLERPPIMGYKPGDKDHEIRVDCDPASPLVGLVFKITSDVHGDLHFMRIYRGTIKAGTRVFNPNRDKKENITRLFEMHADERKIIEMATAGNIVAVVGLKDTFTGDTICDTKTPVQLPSISFPETVMSMAIEPKTSADRNKLSEALSDLRREDPTFGCQYDAETGQMVISGMGELHLEVLQHKLIKDRKLNIRVGKPRVAYKEAISGTAKAEGKFVRQTGGRGQYGHVVLRVEPVFTEDGHWIRDIEFESKVQEGHIPKEYISPVEKGVRDALGSGVLAGYPVVGVKVILLDGSYHPVDSSDIAFEQAGTIAVESAMKKAEPVLLEPIMKLEVATPGEYFGPVQASLLAKRGLITDTRVHGQMRVIAAKVPLVEMFGYSSEIRSATGGRATFTMEPLSYERVPEQVAKQIIP